MLLNKEEKNIPFLKWTALKIYEEGTQDMISTVVVLPSRRACGIMSTYFNEIHTGNSFLMPELIPINEFWAKLSGLAVPDNDILLLELYDIYRKHWSEEVSFEEFLPWGRMMLSDFDEIDKYCVDAGKLFTIIQNEKEIDAMFSIEEELKEIMSHFWKIIHADKPYEKSFLKTWKVLGLVYHEFAETLTGKMMAYDGLAYRIYYERIKKAEEISLPYTQIHFAGFNAFAETDERLIRKIADFRDISMYWDVDTYFMDHPYHEAGNFLRLYKTSFPGIRHYWNEGNTLSSGKKYYLHGAPMHQGQVKVAAELLNMEFQGTSGVILSEEHVLEPLLYDVTDIEQANITMSMPVGDSAVTDWLEILYRINSNETIHKTDLNRLFKHYYFRILTEEGIVKDFKKKILDSSVFFFGKKFLKTWIGHFIVNEQENILTLDGLCRFWIHSLENLKEKIGDVHHQLEIIIPYFIQAIQEKQIILSSFESKISFKAIYQLLIAHIKSLSVPFLTEKIQSVQIMGFLESRLMDFDRVIILGANEEILPRPKRGNSYIPYSLRKPFGLPTLKEYDGIYAYHFFRLLQRSKEVHLVYNNAPGDLPFEKSRFLGQIQLELDTPENKIIHTSWSYPLKESSENERIERTKNSTVIQKTQEHIDKLKQRKISQSALTLYLRCPLQFYLRYVAEIYEPDDTEEIMDAGDFGNVLHRAIELLYEDFKEQEVTEEMIRSRLPFLEAMLKQSFEEKYQSFEQLKGQNLLAYDIILQALKKIIAIDIQMAENHPFTILYLEGELEQKLTLHNGEEITLYGKIDRVDKVGDLFRILDYKTGKVELMTEKNFTVERLPEIFKRHNHETKPQTFQGLFYQFLLNADSVKIGFYSIRDLNKGIQFLNGGEEIPTDIQEVYTEELQALLEEIFDIEKPFVQNPDAKAYSYSPYQFIFER